jgi:hypothetical protein
MSIGYLLNYILPYKLGDLVRAWISGRKMKNGKPLGLSTVIVDRYFDIVSVGFIFLVLSIANRDKSELLAMAGFYIVVAIVLLVVAFALYFIRGTVKKAISIYAKVFNKHIESVILCFAWALIWNFKDIFQKISKIKLILSTVGMWILYLISYYLFSGFLASFGEGITWIDVFTMLFAQNSISSSTGNVTLFWKNESISMHLFYMASYMVVPLILMLVISLLLKPSAESDVNVSYINLLPHLDENERIAFLENYFSNKNREYIINYLKINQDISIIRDYSAGSNATTMLCMDGEITFFRKYAFGEDGEKLYQQVIWIEENSDNLVLPKIIRKKKTDVYCYYDMPYNSHAVGLFEYVHSMPIGQGWKIIRLALERLEQSIYRIDVRPADRKTIHCYIELKVKNNLAKIKAAKRISNLQQYDTIIINGVEYKNLQYYEKILEESNLKKVFANDSYAVIHGDLTIENIICTRSETGEDDFYIIDPNTGNEHDSPNLDYAKLLQSIHGGYEFLMSTKEVKVSGNKINFLFTRSAAYIELHKLLREYMQENLGPDRTRSIYFHEVVHWLRLMPYKIEKGGKRALLFYAGMLMVMNDVYEMYGDEQ